MLMASWGSRGFLNGVWIKGTCSFQIYLAVPFEAHLLQTPFPEGSSAQYLRSLVPKTIEGMVFGTRDLKVGTWTLWVCEPRRSAFLYRETDPEWKQVRQQPHSFLKDHMCHGDRTTGDDIDHA